MKRWEAWTLHLATLLVGGTGLVYAWMRYFATPTEPWAVVNHPWQPLVQHLHLLVAPLLVFGSGLLWKHAWCKVRNRIAARRTSGLALLATLAPMVVSGYLLQITVDGRWRQAWVVVHLAASGLWLLAWGGHLAAALVSRRAEVRSAGEKPTPTGLPEAG